MTTKKTATAMVETTTTTTEHYQKYAIERVGKAGQVWATKLTIFPLWLGLSSPGWSEDIVHNISPDPQYEGLTVVEQQNLDREIARTDSKNVLKDVYYVTAKLHERIDLWSKLTAGAFVALAIANIVNLFI
jgi:hypothetical protein